MQQRAQKHPELLRFVGLRPPRAAWAHSTSESYLYVRPEGDAVDGSMQMSIPALATALGVDLSEEAGPDTLARHRAEIEALYSKCFRLSEGGAPLQLRFGELRTVDTNAGRFCALTYQLREARPLPRTIGVSIEGLIEVDHHQAALVLVRYTTGWGRFSYRHRGQHRLDHHHPTGEFTLPKLTAGDHLMTTARKLMRRSKGRLPNTDRH